MLSLDVWKTSRRVGFLDDLLSSLGSRSKRGREFTESADNALSAYVRQMRGHMQMVARAVFDFTEAASRPLAS